MVHEQITDSGMKNVWPDALKEILLQDNHCSSEEEANTIVDSLQSDLADTADMDNLIPLLCEYVGLSMIEATSLIDKLTATGLEQETIEGSSSSFSLEENDGKGPVDEGEDNDESDLLQPGECELCDRYIKLTRHHLIPKSTWARIEPRILRQMLEGCLEGPFEWVPDLDTGDRKNTTRVTRSQIRNILRYHTIDICRPCHSMIHRQHDNLALATDYNTLDKLLDDPAILPFCKWANKQRTGKYTVR